MVPLKFLYVEYQPFILEPIFTEECVSIVAFKYAISNPCTLLGILHKSDLTPVILNFKLPNVCADISDVTLL